MANASTKVPIALGLAGRFEEAVSTLEDGAGMSGAPLARPHSLGGSSAKREGRGRRAPYIRTDGPRQRGHISASHLALTAQPFILQARHFPQYRTLHSDPRFAAILRKMDEPQQNRHQAWSVEFACIVERPRTARTLATHGSAIRLISQPEWSVRELPLPDAEGTLV